MTTTDPIAPTYTHVGYRPHTGYRTVSARLAGHRLPKPGKTHALNATSGGYYGYVPYVALCGEKVSHNTTPDDEFAGNGRNVWTCGTPGMRPVSCARCLKLLAPHLRPGE